MIEIIQDGQATPRIKLPRNLRQIGNPSGEHKIYVEDFVYTFLHPSSREEAGNPKVAIIVGTHEEEHGTQYYFVRGAFYIDDMTFEKGLPQFSEEHWGFAYKQMKEYFDDEDPDKALQILGVRHGRHAGKTDERYGAGAPDEFQRAALAVAVVR